MVERDRVGIGLVPDAACCCRRYDGQRAAVERLGAAPGGQVFKVHLDGYNILPYLEGQESQIARAGTFSISTMMASWSPCGTTIGNSCSANNAPRET